PLPSPCETFAVIVEFPKLKTPWLESAPPPLSEAEFECNNESTISRLPLFWIPAPDLAPLLLTIEFAREMLLIDVEKIAPPSFVAVLFENLEPKMDLRPGPAE